MTEHVADLFSLDRVELGRVAPTDEVPTQQTDSQRESKGLLSHRENSALMIEATPYGWPDPKALKPRKWLLGCWLLEGEVTAVVGPGGTGKSTICTTLALSLASGRPLLGQELPSGPQRVWIYNLEDAQEELDKQIAAAAIYHSVDRLECEERLYVNSGVTQPLCAATEDGNSYRIDEDLFVNLQNVITEHRVSVIIVDPFISSHGVRENSNEAINAIVRRWKRLAHEANCAVLLVHHTVKLRGRAASADDARGASALRDGARVVLTLNVANEKEVKDAKLRPSIVRVNVGKANRTPYGGSTWLQLIGQTINNGRDGSTGDSIGVATPWTPTSSFGKITDDDLLRVQQGVVKGEWRWSPQARNWVGNLVAEVSGLCPKIDRDAILSALERWREIGALAIDRQKDDKGTLRPVVVTGATSAVSPPPPPPFRG